MSLRDVIKDLMTESDNSTHDLIRYLAALVIMTGLGLSVYDVVVKGHPFSFQEFGTGVGLTFAGVATALGLKKETQSNGSNS